MPPPPEGTKEQWIQSYHKEEERDRQRLELLVQQKVPSGSKQKVLLPEYDPDILSMISLYQHADWDETHPKVTVGAITKGGKKEDVIFLRDENGCVKMNGDGTFNEVCKEQTITKYESESRFLFGVATVQLTTGEVVGKRLKPFCYTNKKVVSHEDYEKQIIIEIFNIKKHGSDREWLEKESRLEGQLWEEDNVKQLKGVSHKKMEMLEQAGIKLVKDLKYLDDTEETMLGICNETKVNGNNGLTVRFIQNIVNLSRNAHEGYSPGKKDHQKSENPYKNRYDNAWKEKISQSVHMKKFVSIRSLVKHMYEETREAFVGTKHEDNFFSIMMHLV